MWKSNKQPQFHNEVELQQERDRRIGAFFKERRELAGLSHQQAAEALGVELVIFVTYENGRTQVPLEDIFALTNILNIPPEEVLALIYDVSFGPSFIHAD